MIHPRIDELLDNVDSRYALVIVAAKRARQINDYHHQLGEARRAHEDRDAVGKLALHGERPFGLEVEEWRLAFPPDAPDLRPERPDTLTPFEVDVLEEVARLESPLELLAVDEVVLPSLDLARAPRSGRRRDGELELGHERKNRLLERPLPGPRGAGDHDDREVSSG